MSRCDGLLRFFRAAGGLKRLRRRGWGVKAGIREPESVADHSFRLALMCMVVGDLKGLDTCKMLRLALIHDLGEAVLGDLTPEDVCEVEKRVREMGAFVEVLEGLPERLKRRYMRLWKELEGGSSEEARLVRELDRFEMALQAVEYFEAGLGDWRLEEFRSSGTSSLRDPLVRSLASLLNPIPKGIKSDEKL